MKARKADPAIVEMQELVNALSDEVQVLRQAIEALSEEALAKQIDAGIKRASDAWANRLESVAVQADIDVRAAKKAADALALGEMDWAEVERIAKEKIERVVDRIVADRNFALSFAQSAGRAFPMPYPPATSFHYRHDAY